MKNVLILSGSPRKNGNSDILCDEFQRGAEEAGHQVERSVWQQKRYTLVLPVIIVGKMTERVYLRTTWQRFCRK